VPKADLKRDAIPPKAQAGGPGSGERRHIAKWGVPLRERVLDYPWARRAQPSNSVEPPGTKRDLWD